MLASLRTKFLLPTF